MALLSHPPAFSRVTNNTLSQLIGKFVTLSVTVLITYFVTHFLGRDAYGAFSLMLNVPGLFFVLTDFGLNALVIKAVSRESGSQETSDGLLRSYFSGVLKVRFALSLILIAFLNALLFFLPYPDYVKVGVRIGSLLILTFGLFRSLNLIFQAKLRYDLSTLALSAGYLFILVASLVCLWLRLPLAVLVGAYVLGGLITFLVGLYFICHRLQLCVGVMPDLQASMRSILVQSIPLGLMFIFSQLSFKEDMFLLSILRMPSNFPYSRESVIALYALPYRVFEISLVIPTFFMNALYPVLVELYHKSRSEFLRYFKRYIGLLVLSGVGLSVAVYILAPYILTIFGGRAFAPATWVLRVLMLGAPLFYLTSPLAWLVVILDGQRWLPVVYLVSAVFNLILNLVLIPQYSFYSATLITVISEALVLGVLFWVSARLWKRQCSE